METQLDAIRSVEKYKEIVEQLRKESEKLLREAGYLLEGKIPGSGVYWKWMVGIGLGILLLMGRSTKKPEPES